VTEVFREHEADRRNDRGQQQAQPGSDDSGNCPSNPIYNEIIEKAARHIYDPAWLGDINALKNKYNCQIATNADAIAFADKALKLPNDTYTDVIPSNEAQERQRSQRGSIKGIGITFPADQIKTGPHQLVDIVRSGPAARAGVQPGDVVTHVNGVDLSTKTVPDTISLILDGQSDDIELSVLRDGMPLRFEMKREEINIPAVESKMLANNIAHISIKTFSQRDAAQELKDAIEEHRGASSFIIDLRDNPGGFTDQALLMASLFLDRGRLLSSRERAASDPSKPEYDVITYDLTDTKVDARRANERSPQQEKVGETDLTRYPDLVDVPVVVLVNGRSASSSEILTAALKDNRAATVMGEKTFGKGIGQTTWYGMPEGSWLQMTTFRYYTPNGVWLGDAQNERYGIQPDIEVKLDANAKKGEASDNQLQAAIEFLSQSR
jgi:carboxyl-terminal processing protease